MDPLHRAGGSKVQSHSPFSRLKKELKKSARWKAIFDTIAIKGLRKKTTTHHNTAIQRFQTTTVKARAKLAPHKLASKAISQIRTLSGTEFCQIADSSPQNDKQLSILCDQLDQYNQQIADKKSTRSSAERVLETLKLRQSVVQFHEKRPGIAKQLTARSPNRKKRMQAADLTIAQLDRLLSRYIQKDPLRFSSEMSAFLHNDLQHNAGKVVTQLLQHPELMEQVLSHFSYPDLLPFLDTFSLSKSITSITPRQVQALTKSCHKVLSKLSSQEIKTHHQAFLQSKGSIESSIIVTGNDEYDRNSEFSWLMNYALDLTPTPREMGIAVYQAYRQKHLTMNMLDEMTELKALGLTMAFTDPSTMAQAAANIDMEAMKSMHVAKQVENIDLAQPKTKDVLWLSKACQFEYLLNGDQSRPDTRYRDFIKCWEKLRFDFIPSYNQEHKKDSLVELNKNMSIELANISPAWLKRLDAASGSPQQVATILAETRWQKMPDSTDFNALYNEASTLDDRELKAQIKKTATQDCLYRYFERRAGVELSTSIFLPGTFE